MASIRPARKNKKPVKGKWEVRVYDPILKRPVSKTVNGTKQKARGVADDLQRSIDRKTHSPAVRLTVSAYMTEWWAEKKQEIAPSTIVKWRPVLDDYLTERFNDVLLVDLTPFLVHREWLAMRDEGIGISTVHECHKILSSACGDAMRLGLIDHRPTTGAGLPTPKNVRVVPTGEELQKIVDAASEMTVEWRLDMIAWLAVMTTIGLRPGEALALRWRSINFATKTVTISATIGKSETGNKHLKESTKTGVIRVAPVNDETLAQLRQLQAHRLEIAKLFGTELPSQAWVFGAQPLGLDLLTQQAWGRRFKKVLTTAEVDSKITPYSLRHWALTEVASLSRNPRTTATFGGHADPSVTMKTYVHEDPAQVREASDLLGKIINFPTTKTSDG